MSSLRKEILELLDKDLEFRYAVAGYLGISEVLKRLESLSEEQVKLREDFNKMLARLGRVEHTLEKLTVDVEDEAKSVIKYKLREIGISLELTSLILPGLEINLYGASDDVCVIGEATVRAGAGLVDELLGKLERLRSNYPDRLRKKVILIIYVSLPMMDLVEKARKKNIWLLKATEEFHKPEKLFFEI